jgi:hypothetical protein
MKHRFFKDAPLVEFSELTAPKWLTSEKMIKGSTMDGRWFWNDHVLKLKVGESINTDFQKITRIE